MKRLSEPSRWVHVFLDHNRSLCILPFDRKQPSRLGNGKQRANSSDTGSETHTSAGQVTRMSAVARLSFRVSPDRMDTFESAYKEKRVPILKNHGLKASSERGLSTSGTDRMRRCVFGVLCVLLFAVSAGG
jgi:hypothetical protein